MARQLTEMIGFAVSCNDRKLMARAAESDGAPSVPRWVRAIAVREARRVCVAPAESGDGRQYHTEELHHRLASLVSAEEACRAIQQDFPALQVDAAEARNAIRNLRMTMGMATSGGLAADRDQTGAVGKAPEGWITLKEAVASLRDRNGYAPEDRWLHKAKGRGLLVDPATWRMCRVRRDGGERQAICIPKR